MEFTRSFALEDISVRSGGDGRTVEAYATVFNTPAYVRDQDGEYEEVIHPTAFDRAIEHARNAKGGWNIPVIFNHGMTIFHTPSEADSVPIGVVDSPRSRAVLEAIKEGSLTAYSFSGVFKKSDPEPPRGRGGFRRDSNGNLTTVKRMISTLREFGPATFPVYQGAEVVGVRAEQIARSMFTMDAEERQRLAAIIAGTLDDEPEIGTPETGRATEDEPQEALRSVREQLNARYAEFIRRSA